MTIQLEEKKIEVEGKPYTLRVNMSVLERLQEDSGGNLNKLLKKRPYDIMATTIAAMLNDWAEDQGWEEHWTAKDVKKCFPLAAMVELDVTGMFFRAITPANSGKQEKPEKQEKPATKTEDMPDAESGN